jgi:hypothetical protein
MKLGTKEMGTGLMKCDATVQVTAAEDTQLKFLHAHKVGLLTNGVQGLINSM